MTEALERAFKEAQRLPEREQREIAELIEQKLSDTHWDELLARPGSDTLLRELATEAIEEDDAGLTYESGESW
jgi:histidinol-phosphate/aromatic aminotransferase/cobyric acid decarboxylase-like protein